MLIQAITTPDASPYQRPQDAACRDALNDAAAHLERSARLLARPEPDYTEVLTSTLRVARQAYTALLEWHSLPPREDASLDELARPAERLASMLRTCRDRGLPIERAVAGLGAGAPATIAVREAALASYFTARNTLITVIAELPERVGRKATAGVVRAQAIRAAQRLRRAGIRSETPVPLRSASQRTPELAGGTN